jgi:hypothetical protein
VGGNDWRSLSCELRRQRDRKPAPDALRIALSVKYFTQNGMNGAYKRMGQLLTCLPDRREILPRRIVMRTLITALAVTAILATFAVAKTPRTKEVHANTTTP